jgi:hypothetical protein
MANWPAYRLLKAEAERLSLPLHYRTDLTQCDRAILSRGNAPERFGWIVRAWGTDLLRPGTVYARVMADYYRYGQDGARYYWYENGRLTPVTAEQMKALAEDADTSSLRMFQGWQPQRLLPEPAR